MWGELSPLPICLGAAWVGETHLPINAWGRRENWPCPLLAVALGRVVPIPRLGSTVELALKVEVFENGP